MGDGRWNRKACQRAASYESTVSDAGDGRWNVKACQRPASFESIVSDAGDGRRNLKACQRAAISESIVSEAGDGQRNGNVCHFFLVHPPFFPRVFTFPIPIRPFDGGCTFRNGKVHPAMAFRRQCCSCCFRCRRHPWLPGRRHLKGYRVPLPSSVGSCNHRRLLKYK